VRRAALALWCVCASAQSIKVYSEFAKINAFGDVTAPENPREILSPAIVRNGFTSFQVVVKVAPGTKYGLYIGENPEDALKVTLYRISGERMEQVSYPVSGSATRVFWMDVWADRDAPVRRVKIEPQLNVGQEWWTYPMEVRVMEAVVPDGDRNGAFWEWPEIRFCGMNVDRALRLDGSRAPLTGPTSRNAAQDVRLATKVSASDLRRLVNCRSHGDDAEWYLRIRDYLFRMR